MTLKGAAAAAVFRLHEGGQRQQLVNVKQITVQDTEPETDLTDYTHIRSLWA